MPGLGCGEVPPLPQGARVVIRIGGAKRRGGLRERQRRGDGGGDLLGSADREIDESELTSGKVPLEKTLQSSRVSMGDACVAGRWRGGGGGKGGCRGRQHDHGHHMQRQRASRKRGNSHQQAGLAAGTVTDDDQLPAELGGHGCCGRKVVVVGCCCDRWRELGRIR